MAVSLLYQHPVGRAAIPVASGVDIVDKAHDLTDTPSPVGMSSAAPKGTPRGLVPLQARRPVPLFHADHHGSMVPSSPMRHRWRIRHCTAFPDINQQSESFP